MKKMSIRLRVTLWFSMVLLLVTALAFVVVFFVSDAVLQRGVQDNLVETVERNTNEIQYFHTLDEVMQSGHVDLYMKYQDGYLVIDDDFLDSVNGICTGLYQEDGTLLYGENPLGRTGEGKPFADALIQRVTVREEDLYLFDRMLEEEGLEGLWLRGSVSKKQGAVQQNTIVHFSLLVMPFLVLLAALEGYRLAGRALEPVKEIENAAKTISQGKDLKKRILLEPGADELHQLADTFNGMLERLDEVFETEQQFISDASHELRTPMSVISAQCEFTLEKQRTAEEYEKAFQVVQRQSRKMNRLIGALLDFTRLERKADSFVREKLDMTELVTGICEDMALLREKDISLAYEAEPGIYVSGNRELLNRLLSNLLSNAYRYGRQQGHILVRLRGAGDEIRLDVEDDGVGIPKDQQEKIFRRFYQADSSRSGQGTGLGLAMVKEIAVFHGGEIRVDSHPEKGSIFTLILPRF